MSWLEVNQVGRESSSLSAGQEDETLCSQKPLGPAHQGRGFLGVPLRLGIIVAVQSRCRSQTLNKDLKGQWGVSLLGGCHGHYPGSCEPPPPLQKHTHGATLQTHAHICSKPTQSSPRTPLFEVEFGNLPNTHGRVYHANFVAWRCVCVWGVGGWARSICGGGMRGKESGEGRRERDGGLKGEREKRRGSLIQEILDPPSPPSAESDTSWNTQTMAQWKKSPLILLLITQKPLCPWALYTFFPFCANALSWEWLVSVDKSPYFILPPQGCCFSGSQLTIMPSRLTVNPSYVWWCVATAFPLLSVADHLSACLIWLFELGVILKKRTFQNDTLLIDFTWFLHWSHFSFGLKGWTHRCKVIATLNNQTVWTYTDWDLLF